MAIEDLGPQLTSTIIAFLTVAWVFVSLRCYVRGILTKGFGLDDGFAVLAVVST